MAVRSGTRHFTLDGDRAWLSSADSPELVTHSNKQTEYPVYIAWATPSHFRTEITPPFSPDSFLLLGYSAQGCGQVLSTSARRVADLSDYSAIEPYLNEPTERRIGEVMR